MQDNFDFKLVGGKDIPFLGYISYLDKTTVGPQAMIKGSQNVLKTLRGTLASRSGLKRYDSLDTTEAGVKSSYEWNSSGGVTKALRVANNKLQVLSSLLGDPTWYDLVETSTLVSPAATYTRFSFNTFYDIQLGASDRLIMVRGDNNILHWSGGMAVIDSTASVSNSVLTATVNAGGSGYAVGDTLTLTGGGGTNCTLEVTTVSTSTITAVRILTVGSGYTAGSGLASHNLNALGDNNATFDITVGTTYTITKTGTTTWAQESFATNVSAEKKIVINGTEYTYTEGEATTTLGGITTDPTSQPNGSLVIQSVLKVQINDYFTEQDDLGDFVADFIESVNNQIIVCSYSSRQVLLSVDSSIMTTYYTVSKYGFANFTKTGSTFVPGDPDRILLDNFPTGIVTKDGKAYVSAGNSDWYILEPNTFTQTQYTIDFNGTKTRVVVTKVSKKTIGTNLACKAHEFVTMSGDDIIFLDQGNQLRTASTLSFMNTTRWPLLSLAIFSDMKEINFTGGHIKKVDNSILLTAPAQGIYLIYEVRENVNERNELISERFWQSPQVSPISRFAVINGVTYGHSSINPQMYQIFDTGQWYDDGQTADEPFTYTCIARMGYSSAKDKNKLLRFDKIYTEGYIQAEEINGRVFYDYNGNSRIEEFDIHTAENPAIFFFQYPPSLGDRWVGENPLGTGIISDTNDIETLTKFKSINGVSLFDNFEYSLQVSSVKLGSRWEMLYLGTNAIESPNSPVWLKK